MRLLIGLVLIVFILVGCADEDTRVYRDLDSEKDSEKLTPESVDFKELGDITLTGNEVKEIVDGDYLVTGNIIVRDHAKLVIKRARLVHKKDYTFQFSLQAEDEAEVILEDAVIGNVCTGSLNWNFFGNSKLTAMNVRKTECNTYNVLHEQASAKISNWEGYQGTTCDQASIEIRDSQSMELELCYPQGAVIDEELSLNIGEMNFPNDNEKNVEFKMSIVNSSVHGWGLNVVPRSDITIRNSPAVTIGVSVGQPWIKETVTLEGLGDKYYLDQVWDVVDAKLRLINTSTYGWEPNVFGDNVLIVKNSEFTGSTLGSSGSREIVEDSVMEIMRAQEDAQIVIKNSLVKGDVIASDESKIILINTVVEGRIIEEGGVVVQQRE